jgi:hypothetical protein
MIMSCSCPSFSALELSHSAITKRIKATRRLLSELEQLSENKLASLKLLVCSQCGQYWQTGREWNFEYKEYAFQVPTITVDAWQAQPYTQPASWLIYEAVMGDYIAKNTFEPSDKQCRVAECEKQAIKSSGVCKEHHIAQLQHFRILPKQPSGRLFAPYMWSQFS